MSKTMINTNRAVLVNYASNTNENQVTSSGAADIYVPFKVSQINIKGIDLDFESDFRVMYFTSDLVDSGPLGSGYAGILCDNSTTTKQMTYLFKDPRDINGNYTFTYHILDTTAFYFANGFIAGTGPDTSTNVEATDGSPVGRVLFMLEFIGYV
jgi:maltose-binding protein MalE